MSYIGCPNCGEILSISVSQGRIFYFEPFRYDEVEGKYYAPRGMFQVKKEDYKKRIDFLLSKWAEKIIVYDENKKVVETLWK